MSDLIVTLAVVRLIAFSLEGYRHFVEKTSVKLHGDMIALVGPNEAGKSSLLKAMTHLHNTEGFAASELPRRSPARPTLSWHFQLEAPDKSALRTVFGGHAVERLVITKKADASRVWSFEPHALKRDRAKRTELRALLEFWRGDPALAQAEDSGDFDPDRYSQVMADLEQIEDWGQDQLSNIETLADELRELEPPADSEEETSDRDAEPNSNFWTGRSELTDMLDAVHELEAQPSPWRQAVEALRPLVPQIELFGFEDRDLASEYDLNEVATSPPAALMHLAKLAELSLEALRDEANSGAIADVATRRNAANRQLLEKFDQSWNQQGIAVQLEVQGAMLHVQAITPEDNGLSPITDRSDGLRWFASLLAFADGWDRNPILLVDELETHLHYDAQADLIAVLAKQRFTSKVVYTTHSFGCLPFDLGTGVRVVQPVNAATSRLENGFWRAGAGFSPLLASMGAAAFSFTPTRHALVAEGPSDAILLPTLFRQAGDMDRLSFQVAPGLASIASAAVHTLEHEAGKVAFLVDGDEAGHAIKTKLTSAGGIDAQRVLVLQAEAPSGPVGLESEDLVDPAMYLDAVNDEIRMWNSVTSELSLDVIQGPCRSQAVEEWCVTSGYSKPDKVAVAQRIVDASASASILDESKRGLVNSLRTQIELALGIA